MQGLTLVKTIDCFAFPKQSFGTMKQTIKEEVFWKALDWFFYILQPKFWYLKQWAFLRIFIAVKRYHDYKNSYKRKHLTGASLQFRL